VRDEQVPGERDEATTSEIASYTEADLFRLAVHEAGHALVALAVGYASAATIEIEKTFDRAALGYLGGVTEYELVEDNLPTETSLLNRIAVGYAGMAAEAVVFEDRSVGSGGTFGSDIERVTSIARRMVGSYGFGTTPAYLGAVDTLGDKPLPMPWEREVMKILDLQYRRVQELLGSERERVIALAADVVAHRFVRIARSEHPNTA
jgi:ATP-dependent Zn protease